MNSSSHLQEIKTKAVSNFRIHLPKRFSKKNETQAGVTDPIPRSSRVILPPNTPACKLAPGHNKEIGVLGRSEKLRGAHFRLATQFREHLTGAQNPCCVTSFCKVRGSNPHQSIPSQFHSCVGNRMNEVNKPRSLYLSFHRYSGCGSAIAVSVPLRCNPLIQTGRKMGLPRMPVRTTVISKSLSNTYPMRNPAMKSDHSLPPRQTEGRKGTIPDRAHKWISDYVAATKTYPLRNSVWMQ